MPRHTLDMARCPGCASRIRGNATAEGWRCGCRSGQRCKCPYWTSAARPIATSDRDFAKQLVAAGKEETDDHQDSLRRMQSRAGGGACMRCVCSMVAALNLETRNRGS